MSEPVDVKVVHMDCDHDILALIIGQEIVKVLNSLPKKDALKTKMLVSFDGCVQVSVVE